MSIIAADSSSMRVISRQIVARLIAHHEYNWATNCEGIHYTSEIVHHVCITMNIGDVGE